jgi:hypothetical protein
MFQTKFLDKKKTHILFTKTASPPPPPETPAVYEIMCKNIVERGMPQMTVLRMRIERYIPNTTDTHSEYVILIAFPLQQCLHERGQMLRYTCIACVLLMENASVYLVVGTERCIAHALLPQNRTDDAPYASAQISNYRQQCVPAGLTQLSTDVPKCRATAP